MPMKVFCYICLLSLAFATASCVYDFQPDYQGQGGYVAIEGDILIGESCTFTARLSTDLLDPERMSAKERKIYAEIVKNHS